MKKEKARIIRTEKSVPRRKRSAKDEAEFGRGKEELVFCSGCGSVYYRKSWHHRIDDLRHLNENKAVKFTLCPACLMIKNRQFEGELTISGIKSDKQKGEIKRALKNGGEQASERDPMDRIISVQEGRDSLVVLTTENQLAVRLAKKIRLTFGGEMQVSHSHDGDVVRVRVEIVREVKKS